MATSSHWGSTPQQSIEAECIRRGKDALVAGCVRLIAGDYTDAGLIMALGGPGANRLLDGQSHADDYWFRVWATRGLLWAWDDSAAEAVGVALQDESWRVREMAAKVVARHHVGDALSAVAELRDDPVPRVREAASRAVMLLTQASA
jgi:HEAT repeat protein